MHTHWQRSVALDVSHNEKTFTRLKKEVVKNKNAYFFISPFYLVFLVFMVFPIGFSFYLSFQNWNGIMSPRFIGFDNYRRVFTDPAFLNALKNTGIFVFFTVSISTFISLCLALFLNTVRIFKRFYRAIFFVPAIVSLVVVSLVWKLILNSDIGAVHELITNLGNLIGRLTGTVPKWTQEKFQFLDHPNPLVPLLTITLVNVWAVVGFNTVIFLAGLQGIPAQLYEAGRIDGSTAWQNLRFITLPLLKPTIFFVILISTIDALQVFVLPNVMKPDSEATMTVVYFLYRNAFQFYKMGYASAIAYILFALTVVIGVVIRLLMGKEVSTGGYDA